jgi:hypothetical protein
MRPWKLLALPIVTAAMVSTIPAAPAQVSVNIGVAPVCPYGYYSYAPYNCAPYGFYGPEWFTGGVFLGAGPWFHGPHNFYGHVDEHFDPHHGYHGPYPNRGEHPDQARFQHFQGHPEEFHGGGMRDGRGHEGGPHR